MKNVIRKFFKGLKNKARLTVRGACVLAYSSKCRQPLSVSRLVPIVASAVWGWKSLLRLSDTKQSARRASLSVSVANGGIKALCGTQTWFRNSRVLAPVSKRAFMGQTRTSFAVTFKVPNRFSTLKNLVKKSEIAQRPILEILVLHYPDRAVSF